MLSWVGLRAGLDAVEKRKILPPPGIEPGPSSPSLYRLSYPDSYPLRIILIFNRIYSHFLQMCFILASFRKITAVYFENHKKPVTDALYELERIRVRGITKVTTSCK
jgi:hypothetical protein